MIKIVLLLASSALVSSGIIGTQSDCPGNSYPWQNYNYNKVVGSAEDGTPSTLQLNCDTSHWDNSYISEGDDDKIYFFKYKLGVHLKNAALSFEAFQEDEGSTTVAMALYGTNGSLLAYGETLDIAGNNDELSWYLWPLPTNMVLAPGTYTIAILNAGDDTGTIQIPYTKYGSTSQISYKWFNNDESSFPPSIDSVNLNDAQLTGPIAVGLVGNKTTAPPPIVTTCNCTLEVWFDANCTNPANGTEEVVFAGGCSHLKLPHTNYAIATAHDCSGFAIYHGLECFGNTTIQRPNTCFTDMKKSYLLTCPPTHLEYPPYPPMTDMSMEARMERVKRRGPMDSVPME
eukprot:TRINITY_DN66503_c9_g4_i3.p1 TRINITY_DN66503_c9_g4~~TRINITY_DN66503_c9_g4_i3.p1  ORF type:complete len:344 (-),score=58.87 TRINITY_DN66503_c9_g4_i3:178-1209(-)